MRWLGVALVLAATAAADDARPLPVRASITLNGDGAVYYVEGRRTIAWGTEINVHKRIEIVGRGDDAVLEVAGALNVIGIPEGFCYISNLRVELAPRFRLLRLYHVLFRDGGGIFVPEGRPAAGTVVIENAELLRKVKLDLTMQGGKLRLLNTMFFHPVHIRAVPEEGKRRATLQVDIISNFLQPLRPGAKDERSNYSGFVEGFFLTGAHKPVLRNNRFRGQAEIVDCPGLTFDGNKVDTERLVIRHTVNGGFQRTRIQKCDFSVKELVLSSPAGKAMEKVTIDKCWFRGVTDPKSVHQSFIRDGHDSEDCGVKAVLRKINKRPLGLAGKPK
jgi:hypothetical protein